MRLPDQDKQYVCILTSRLGIPSSWRSNQAMSFVSKASNTLRRIFLTWTSLKMDQMNIKAKLTITPAPPTNIRMTHQDET